MTIRRHFIRVITDAGGGAAQYSRPISGTLCAIHYIKNDYDDGVDFAITTEATGETLWIESNVNESKMCVPRVGTHTTAGVSQLYSAGGTAVTDMIRIGHDTIKIAVARGGDTKTGEFHIVVED